MHGNTAKQIVRIITGILIALFIIMVARSFAAYDGVTCVDDETTYCIDTLEKLQNISPDNLTKECYLTDNIDASGSASLNDGAGFAPIVNFSGLFDGNGFTISGLTVSDTTGHAGLFGLVRPESADVAIRDVTLDDVSVTGNGIVGGLIGSVNMGSSSEGVTMNLSDCRVASGTVSGTGTATGGLVGYVVSSITGRFVTMENCSSMASVSGVSGVGGLVGVLEGNVTVEKCLNTGNVTATGEYAAGLIAYVRATRLYVDNVLTGHLIPEVSNCYARGTVSGLNTVGGFVAVNEGVISYCYCAGHVFGESTEQVVGGFCPYFTPEADSPAITFDENYFDKTLFFDDHGSDDGLFDGISGLVTGDMNKVAEYYDAEDTSKDWDFAGVWAVEEVGDDLPYPFFRFKGGDGSPEAPYRIADVYGLQGIGANTELIEAHYILISDVDAGITKDWNDGQGFLPVGSASFAGNVSGQGFVIHDLYINRPSSTMVGLFANLGASAVIDQISIENASVVGANFTGILLGYGEGTITNCSVSGSVEGMSPVGGLGGLLGVGHTENCSSFADVFAAQISGGLIGNLSGGTVVNCQSRGRVYANDHAGGLIGRMTGGSLSGCMANGAVYGENNLGGLIGTVEGNSLSQFEQCASSSYVSGEKYVGGFAGLANGSFQSCLSSGSVRGTFQTGGFAGVLYGSVADCKSSGNVDGYRQAGGFAGYVTLNGSITRSYSKGLVTGTELTGGLVGVNGAGEDGVHASFWDLGTSGQSLSDGGQGLSTDAMMQSLSFSGWDFESTWAIIEGITRPYLQLPMVNTNLTLSCTSPVTFLDDDDTFNVQLTVTNIGGETAGGLTIQPSFNVPVAGVQYSLDGGGSWQDVEDLIGIDRSLAIGQSLVIRARGTVHAENVETAEAGWIVDFEGIDTDQADNKAVVTWDMGAANQGESDTPQVYGGDGGGCFIQSANER